MRGIAGLLSPLIGRDAATEKGAEQAGIGTLGKRGEKHGAQAKYRQNRLCAAANRNVHVALP